MLPLFDAVETPSEPSAGPNVTPGAGGLWAWEWTCRGCGSRCGSSGETKAQIEADPVCCYCRAEYCGESFSTWRKRPLAERMAIVVPADFRAQRDTHRTAAPGVGVKVP